MENFKRDNFEFWGGYLNYRTEAGERKFVARLKYGAAKSKGPWITFMMKNFTVEEYFAAMEEKDSSPLGIMEAKGFLLSHIKKMLKDANYPITRAGFDKYISDSIVSRKAKEAAEAS